MPHRTELSIESLNQGFFVVLNSNFSVTVRAFRPSSGLGLSIEISNRSSQLKLPIGSLNRSYWNLCDSLSIWILLQRKVSTKTNNFHFSNKQSKSIALLTKFFVQKRFLSTLLRRLFWFHFCAFRVCFQCFNVFDEKVFVNNPNTP